MVGVVLLWRQADEAQRERWLDTTGRIDPLRVLLGGGGWASYARLAAGVAPDRHRACCCSAARRLGRWPATSVVAGLLGVVGLAIAWGRGCSGWPPTSRRARRAGPHPGARRRRRPPARLGPADPGADPEERRRRPARSPGWPAPRSATCGPGCTRRATDDGTVATALRGVAAEVEDGHGVAVEVVTVGDLDYARRAADGARRPARRSSTRPSTPAPAGSTSTPRSPRGGRGVRHATGGAASTRPPCPRTGTASGTASSTGWNATAAPPRSGPRPARAPRCGCTCPGQQTRKATTNDDRLSRDRSGGDRRRPRHVPGGRPRRARGSGVGRRTSSRRPRTSTRRSPRSPRTSPTWCCSTYTCPAAAASR